MDFIENCDVVAALKRHTKNKLLREELFAVVPMLKAISAGNNIPGAAVVGNRMGGKYEHRFTSIKFVVDAEGQRNVEYLYLDLNEAMKASGEFGHPCHLVAIPSFSADIPDGRNTLSISFKTTAYGMGERLIVRFLELFEDACLDLIDELEEARDDEQT